MPRAGVVPVTAMHRIVEAATRAPSVHNTQPWRWRASPDVLELFVDRTRRLPATDPDGRNMIISCGAALHHAQVVATALGWAPSVTRHPDPGSPDLLARLELAPSPPCRPREPSCSGPSSRGAPIAGASPPGPSRASASSTSLRSRRRGARTAGP